MRSLESLSRWAFAASVLCLAALLAGCGDDAPPRDDADADAGIDGDATGGCQGALTLDGESVALGDACGPCGDGAVLCGEGGVAVCVGAGALNACGACGPLGGELGDACGRCGALACGPNGGLVCEAGADENACGGCGPLDGNVGAVCEADGATGIERCVGPDEVACVGLADNGCGGSDTLENAPGTACGTCGFGVWACDGTDAVVCSNEERGVNACGGCGLLEGQPDTACGSCGGVWTCSADGARVTCEGDVRNACGGCAPITGLPGAACGDGGVTYCVSDDALACAAGGANACGGVAPLDAIVGDPCGECGDGTVVCAGAERTRCVGASSRNVCGGCGFLPGTPGESCAPRAEWACVDDVLACEPEKGANPCGGTAELDGAPGDACGACGLGRLRCDGFDALDCAEPDPSAVLAYADADADGFGDPETAEEQCALADGFVRAGGDCDDTDGDVHPDAAEVCDGVDNNCDGRDDEGAADQRRFFQDADADGFGDAASEVRACAQPEGFVDNADDCDDTRSRVFPDAPEDDCTDPIDYNCDGEVAFVDADEDGFAACVDGCDDDPTRTPVTAETCNEADDNCNGAIDEGAVDALTFYADVDSDGAGDPDAILLACTLPDNGFVAVAGDCDDADATAYFGAPEVCDGVDNDCDGVVDPDDAADATTWYRDVDGDGFGVDTESVVACAAPEGYVAAGGDCDDTDAAVNPTPTNTELCDFRDNDCDGAFDEADANGTEWFYDLDGDGVGGDESFVGCVADVLAAAPVDASLLTGDCNDGSRRISPFEDERPGDNVDQNCDEAELCFVDADGDGFVDSSDPSALIASTDNVTCDTADGEATADAPRGDCDDADPAINPSAGETPADATDANCDGLELCYVDADRDGFGPIPDGSPRLVASANLFCPRSLGLLSRADRLTDCDDTVATTYPGAPDSALDDVDDNCDGIQGDASTAYFVSPEGAAATFLNQSCGRTPTPASSNCGLWYSPYETDHPCTNDVPASGDFKPIRCEVLVAEGTYDVNTLELNYRASVIGGYSADFTERSDDPTRTVLNPSNDAFGPTVLLSEVFWGIFPEQTDVQFTFANLTIGAAREEVVSDGLAGMVASLVMTSPGELVLDNVIVEGANATGDSTTQDAGDTSAAVALAPFASLGPVQAVVRDSVIRVGQGGVGEANEPGVDEPGPAIAVAVNAPRNELVFEGNTRIETTVASAGGARRPGTTVACDSTAIANLVQAARFPGLRCRDAFVGEDGPVREVFIGAVTGAGAPSEFAQHIFSRTGSDGAVSVYNLITDFAPRFADAESLCASWGGQLASIESAQENGTVARTAIALLGNPTPDIALGLADMDEDGAFEWPDGASPTYAPWSPGQPASVTRDRCALSRGSAVGGPLSGWETDICTRVGPAVCWFPPSDACVLGASCGDGGVCALDTVSGETRCFPGAVGGRRAEPVVRVDDVLGNLELIFDLDRDDAQAACQAAGGTLAEPRTDAEARQVEDIVSIGLQTRAWIGAVNRTNAAVFVWRDGTPLSADEQRWATGEPGPEGATDLAVMDVIGSVGATTAEAEVSSADWVVGAVHHSPTAILCERRLR